MLLFLYSSPGLQFQSPSKTTIAVCHPLSSAARQCCQKSVMHLEKASCIRSDAFCGQTACWEIDCSEQQHIASVFRYDRQNSTNGTVRLKLRRQRLDATHSSYLHLPVIRNSICSVVVYVCMENLHFLKASCWTIKGDYYTSTRNRLFLLAPTKEEGKPL